MEIKVIKNEEKLWISLQDVCDNVFECTLDDLKTDFNLYDTVKRNRKALQFANDYEYVEGTCFLRFCNWYKTRLRGVDIHSFCVWLKNILSRSKRKYNVSHKIDIAYRQGYKCGHCKLFPIPPAFEIDHKIPLESGGLDDLRNLWALCPNCHKEKTRRENLKKHRLFEDINTLPNKKSKYFDEYKRNASTSKNVDT